MEIEQLESLRAREEHVEDLDRLRGCLAAGREVLAQAAHDLHGGAGLCLARAEDGPGRPQLRREVSLRLLLRHSDVSLISLGVDILQEQKQVTRS